MARHDLREVVLVEEDLPGPALDGAPTAGPADAAPSGDTGRPGPRRPVGDRPDGSRLDAGRRRVRWLAVVGVLAGLLVVAATTDAVHERRRAERLADVPGLLAPLGPTVGEVWRHPAGWGHMTTIGGDILLGRVGPGGTDELVGVDGATGAELWVAPVPELGPSREIWCDTLGDAERLLTTSVVCLLTPSGDAGLGRAGATDPDRAQGALLLAIDTRTGERTTERRMPTRYPAIESLGAELAVVEVLPDAHVRVQRVRPAPWEVRWTFRSREPLPTTGRFRDVPRPVLQRDVLLVTGATGWALTPDDGALLDSWDLRGAGRPVLLGAPAGDTVTVLPDGRFAVGRPGGATARTGGYADVLAAGEADGFPVPGPVLRTAVDDGSGDDVVLTTRLHRARLTAQDAASGRRLWTREGDVRGDALLLERRLVVVLDGALTALDVHSGAVLWQVPLEDASPRGLATDGVVVTGAVPGPEGRWALVAWGVEDGRERWRAALPADVDTIRSVGRRLLASTDDDLVGLGDPHADRSADRPADADADRIAGAGAGPAAGQDGAAGP